MFEKMETLSHHLDPYIPPLPDGVNLVRSGFLWFDDPNNVNFSQQSQHTDFVNGFNSGYDKSKNFFDKDESVVGKFPQRIYLCPYDFNGGTVGEFSHWNNIVYIDIDDKNDNLLLSNDVEIITIHELLHMGINNKFSYIDLFSQQSKHDNTEINGYVTNKDGKTSNIFEEMGVYLLSNSIQKGDGNLTMKYLQDLEQTHDLQDINHVPTYYYVKTLQDFTGVKNIDLDVLGEMMVKATKEQGHVFDNFEKEFLAQYKPTTNIDISQLTMDFVLTQTDTFK